MLRKGWWSQQRAAAAVLLVLVVASVIWAAVQPPDTAAVVTSEPGVVPHAGAPVMAAGPTSPPSAARHVEAPDGSSFCDVADGARAEPASTGDADGVVTVDPDPVGATLVWIPGMNATHCAAQITTLDQAAARHLATDLDAAQPMSLGGGAINCPAGDLASVDVYLRYPGESLAETVRVEMNGCGMASAPGRSPRFAREAVQTDLEALAPPGWTDRFGG